VDASSWEGHLKGFAHRYGSLFEEFHGTAWWVFVCMYIRKFVCVCVCVCVCEVSLKWLVGIYICYIYI
jgi:hypothetical protein